MQNDYKNISVETDGLCCTITLNRPEVRNALNFDMLQELESAFSDVYDDKTIRYVILRGNGKIFCAGADINWFSEVRQLTREQQKVQLGLLPKVLSKIYHSPKPVISLVHGAAIGGAIGLIAASDFVCSKADCQFAFSEVKLGLSASTISPFVFNKTGIQKAKQLMLTGETFDAEKAKAVGLVTHDWKKNSLEQLLNNLLAGDINAQQQVKKLTNLLGGNFVSTENLEIALNHLIEMVNSEEVDRRFQAFLKNKRSM